MYLKDTKPGQKISVWITSTWNVAFKKDPDRSPTSITATVLRVNRRGDAVLGWKEGEPTTRDGHMDLESSWIQAGFVRANEYVWNVECELIEDVNQEHPCKVCHRNNFSNDKKCWWCEVENP